MWRTGSATSAEHLELPNPIVLVSLLMNLSCHLIFTWLNGPTDWSIDVSSHQTLQMLTPPT